MKFCAKGIKNQLTYLRKEVQFNAGLGSVLVLLNNMFYSKHLIPMLIEMQLMYFVMFSCLCNRSNYRISFYSLYCFRLFNIFCVYYVVYLVYLSKCKFNFSIYFICYNLVNYYVSSYFKF
jgi:hypothetical protein